MTMSILRRITNLFHRSQLDQEIEAELRAHIEMRTADNVAAGMSPEEARRQAALRFGSRAAMKERVVAADAHMFLDSLWKDVHYALRMLRKSPGFTAVAVLTLALGIGATVAVFSVLDGIVLQPLAYPHAEQLVSINISPLAVDPAVANMAPEDYFVFRDQGHTFQQIGIYSASLFFDNQVNVTGLAEPERVHALEATYDVLTTLAVSPALGRTFSARDDSPGAPLTVLLTYGYWQRKFGGDRSAIGKSLTVEGQPRQIIGVLPANFRFLDMQELSLILPLQLDRSKTLIGGFSYFGIARLKPGVTLTQATADAARLLPVALNSFPPQPGYPRKIFEDARLTPRILPLKEEVVGNVGTFLWVIMGGIGMVLLIACANVANLLLVRTEGRRHELALRAALGASRRRVAIQLLRESVVIGILGGTGGLGFAWASVRFLVAHAPAGLPRVDEIRISPSVLCFALAATLVTSLLFGLIPVFKYSDARANLAEGTRILGITRERHHARNLLIAVQVALALVLLVCSGLMIRTFRALTHVNPGFARPAEVQTFRISIPKTDAPDDTSIPHIEQQIQDNLAAIPGISSVGFSSSVPLDGANGVDNVYAEDHTYANGKLPPFRRLIFISPGYLRSMGIPIIAGRDLTWTDTYNKLPVALISEDFAREYWGSPTEALGKRIRTASIDDWRQVIGVVGDVHDRSMDKPARSTVYWPILLKNFSAEPLQAIRDGTFVLRSSRAGTETLMSEVRRAVWSVDAKLPLANVYTLSFLYTKSLARTSFTLVLLGIAGAMALVLGTVGLYGAIAYSVSQRTREIGIRMALGAQRRDLLRLVLREGMLVVVVGLGCGLASSMALTHFLSGLLYGVSPMDPATFATVALLLMLVALLACYIPARRAMKVDPMVALRYE
jgi:predicted permease